MKIEKPCNVLFLCTGNRARSILAEAILRHRGQPNFLAYSAGSHFRGVVHPAAFRILAEAGISTHGLRSKSWDEFARPGAPEMDFVFTLCDNVARETCPVWPGQPMRALWSLRDPGDAGDNLVELHRMFREGLQILDRRIGLFLSLPFASLDSLAIEKEVDRIGRE
jgi:arsenate reductase (thioredoxin)